MTAEHDRLLQAIRRRAAHTAEAVARTHGIAGDDHPAIVCLAAAATVGAATQLLQALHQHPTGTQAEHGTVPASGDDEDPRSLLASAADLDAAAARLIAATADATDTLASPAWAAYRSARDLARIAEADRELTPLPLPHVAMATAAAAGAGEALAAGLERSADVDSVATALRTDHRGVAQLMAARDGGWRLPRAAAVALYSAAADAAPRAQPVDEASQS